MASTTQPHDATLISGSTRLRGVVRDVLRYRELLTGLVSKELKVKYKGSVLGFAWSMLNPAMYLVVFWLVFDVILGSGIPHFEIFLLSALLAWNFFNTALNDGTNTVVANAPLVGKVYFPRVILPLAAVGAALIHFFLQAIVLVVALAIFQYGVAWSYMPLLIPALAALLVLATAFAVFLSAVNVYARDTRHLVELGMLAWFWMTPIVYPFRLVGDKLVANGWPSGLFLLNPMTPIVITFQRAIYGVVGGESGAAIGTSGKPPAPGTPAILPDANQLWYLRNLVFVGIAASLLLLVALKIFRKVEGNFAEEI